MYHTVRVPKKLSLRSISVDRIEVQKGDRVRRQQVLAYLRVSKKKIVPIVAPGDGWVKLVAVKEQAHIKRSNVLFIIDSMATDDYQVDSTEVNGLTELGENGRRGLERDGQRSFVESYSDRLFDAPEAHHGNGQRAGVEKHPIITDGGVPLKMSADATANQAAVDRCSENARNNPELQKQLGNQLQQQLGIGSAPSSAPTPRAA